jgi:hypothetical protein
MVDVRFEGRVYPAGLQMSIRKHRRIAVREIDVDYVMRFDLTISGGHVVVDCEVDNYRREVHNTLLFTRASDIANAAVNLATFAMGAGATVVLHSFIEADGERNDIVLSDRELAALCTAYSPDDESFDEVMTIVHMNLRISRAIRDLTEAMSGPHLIPSMCARAIETIRVVISPEGSERKAGWALMQRNLNVSQDYIRSITDYGVAPRHGDHEFVPAAATSMIATRSWTIMNRFLEYKKCGDKPLPLSDLPLLTA